MSRTRDRKSLATTAVLAVVLGLALFGARAAAQSRQEQSRALGPGPIVQAAPKVTLLDRVTSRRRITGATDLVERMADAPETGDVVGVSDRLTRKGGSVTLEREVVRRTARPLPLLRSSIDAAFSTKGETYETAFGASYEWENPDDKPAEMRFAFSPPEGGGTLSGLLLKINAHRIRDPEASRGDYVWTGTVPAHARVTATVSYRTEGSRAYRYEPGTGRISGLEFRVRGDRVPDVLGASLAPYEAHSTAAVWRVTDVRTDAPIAFEFAPMVLGEAGHDRAFLYAPFALAVFALGAWLVRAERSAMATVAFAVGLAGIAVLAAYLPPTWAVFAGATLAGLLGGTIIGTPRGALLGLTAALLAAAPSLEGNLTFALWSLGLLALRPAVVRWRREAPVGKRAYVT